MQVGWYDPIASFNSSSLGPGASARFRLPAATRSDTNFVLVRPDWVDYKTARVPNFFFSWRLPERYDVGLPLVNARRVLVHRFNGSRSDTYHKSELMASLVPGASAYGNYLWRDSTSGLVVRALSASSSGDSGEFVLCR